MGGTGALGRFDPTGKRLISRAPYLHDVSHTVRALSARTSELWDGSSEALLPPPHGATLRGNA